MARAIEVDLDAVEKEFYTDLTANYYDSYGRGFTAGLKAMLGFLKEQPTIDPMKQEWISVKDRLPEEKVKVLVVLGSNIRGKRICIDQRISGNWRGLGCLVTHWMPLPEPPKEGE